MDASFHGSSNDTIGSRVRPWKPKISLSSLGDDPFGLHLCHQLRMYTLTSTCGGKGGHYMLPSSYGSGPLNRSNINKIVFSLPMLPSLVG